MKCKTENLNKKADPYFLICWLVGKGQTNIFFKPKGLFERGREHGGIGVGWGLAYFFMDGD